MTADNYAPSTALTAYYPSRDVRGIARHWAIEKLIHDLAAIGLLTFFEGPGPNPLALSGAATDKLWLHTDAGVTTTSGTFKRYTGTGSATDEANWIAVTPGSYLHHLGSLSPVSSVADYASRSVAAAATIAGGTTYLRTAGYASVGDGGDALYEKVLSEPAHVGKFQSADGAWWELSEPIPNSKMLGSLANAFAYVDVVGGPMRIPAGDYALTSVLSISAAAKPFHIYGDGKGLTNITRAASIGTPINIDSTDWWQLSDLSVDAGFSSFPTNANHGITFFDCNHSRIRRVHVTNYKNSSILGYTSVVSNPPTHTDCWVEECSSDGGGVANNGMLLVNLSHSGIRGSAPLNIGKSGSPCYAVQLKNGCQYSSIVDCTGEGASVGFAIGNNNESNDDYSVGNSIIGGHILNCNEGVVLGSSHRGTIAGLNIDMGSAGNHAIDFGGDSTGWHVSATSVYGLATGSVYAAIFRSGDTDNVVNFDVVSKPSAVDDDMVAFLSGALRNTARIARVSDPTTIDGQSTIVSNAGGPTNVFEYGAVNQIQSATIASDVIAVRDHKVRLIRLDTEGSASSDELATINDGTDGQIISLFTRANARDVVVKDATGNIRLVGSGDFTLSTSLSVITLMYNSIVSVWVEIGRAEAT